ncbi:flippase [Neobacillus sp. WH10]|uniref:flippase n=1 Tax=Neobacillus sp. WH10 TaxID=3047873 RepID=UPI0024C1B530|nr:flippase [Neobacillus sp. WH10]WHY76635.1 flippase [Neobacillus sp. WH10]
MSTFALVKNKFKSKFIKNTSWLMFENIFRMVLSIIVTSLMARYLGTHNFGVISYGTAYITIFATVSKLGIDSILVHEIIQNREETGKMVGTTIVLRLLSSLLSVLIIYVIVAYLNPDNSTLQLITFIQSISLLFVALDTVGFWFQSNLESKYAVISKSVAFILVSIWRLGLIYFNASMTYFAFSTILETFVIGAFIVAFYFKFKGQRLGFSAQIAKRLLLRSYHFIIAGLLITIYTQISRIMTGQMAGESAVGIYAAAATVSSLWVFVPNALIESARPLVMTAKSKNEGVYVERYKKLLCSIIWFGVIASVIITALSKPIIIIVFGNEYIESIGVMAVLIWSRIFSLIGTARSIWLVSENFIHLQKYFVGIGAFVNVVLNLMLIPFYGAFGAAIATLFAEVFSSTLALLLFKETRPLLGLIIESLLFKGVKFKDSNGTHEQA